MTSGLVLCCLAMEYVSFSKRFMPELVNFLLGILHLAVRDKAALGTCSLTAPQEGVQRVPTLPVNQACVAGYTVVPPFRPTGKFTDLLVLSDSESCNSWSKKSLPLSTSHSLELKTDLERDHHR